MATNKVVISTLKFGYSHLTGGGGGGVQVQM